MDLYSRRSVLAGAASLAPLAIANATFSKRAHAATDSQLEQFLDEIYRPFKGKVIRWTIPIRYRIYGGLPAPVTDYIKGQLKNLAQALSLDISENPEQPTALANLGLFFTPEVEPFFRFPEFLAPFKMPLETDEMTKERLQKTFKSSMQTQGWEIGKDSILHNTQLLNIRFLNSSIDIRRPILLMLFNALTGVGNSDIIQPSVLNNPGALDFSVTDLGLLKALYLNKEQIRHESLLNENRSSMVRLIQKYS